MCVYKVKQKPYLQHIGSWTPWVLQLKLDNKTLLCFYQKERKIYKFVNYKNVFDYISIDFNNNYFCKKMLSWSPN